MTMLRKAISGPVSFKADGQTGEFTAVFSRFSVKDADGDVTLPDAFTDGEEIRISAWGHGWDQLPVGKGVVHFDGAQAWVDGQFFLDTQAGRETYLTVKNLGSLQEWSYGYKVLDSAPGTFEGETVRFLKRLRTIEASPVMQGAGVGTHTAAIKSVAVTGAKAQDFQTTLTQEQTEATLWDERWKINRALEESVESILQDAALDQSGKLAMVQQSGDQYVQALASWATRAILAGFGSDEKARQDARVKAREAIEAKLGNRNNAADQGRHKRMVALLDEMRGLMGELMGSGDQTPGDNQTGPVLTGPVLGDAPKSDEPIATPAKAATKPTGEAGKGTSPTTRKPQEAKATLAARVALALLDEGAE